MSSIASTGAFMVVLLLLLAGIVPHGVVGVGGGAGHDGHGTGAGAAGPQAQAHAPWLPVDAALLEALKASGLGGCSLRKAGADGRSTTLSELPAGSFLPETEQHGEGPVPFVVVNDAGWSDQAWSSPADFVRNVGPRVAQVRYPTGANQLGIIARNVSIKTFVGGGQMRRPRAGLLFDGETSFAINALLRPARCVI